MALIFGGIRMETSKLLGQKIHDMALDCGFDDCGIIPIDDMDGFNERLQQREKRVPSSFLLSSRR